MDSLSPQKITDLSTPYCSPIKDLLIHQKIWKSDARNTSYGLSKLATKIGPDLEKTPINSPRFLSENGQFGPEKNH